MENETIVEMRAIALLIPGYAAKMPCEKRKLVNRPSQAAPPVEETPESMVELHSNVVACSRDPRRDQQAQSQAAPAIQRRCPRRARQAQSEGVQLSITGLAHTTEQHQSKAASIAPKRQMDHESYLKKVRRLEHRVC